MENKVIIVKELKTGTTKTDPPKNYPVIYDQDNEVWHIFNQMCPLELNKCYLFRFDFNDKGYRQIRYIEPLINIFKQQALKETASRSEYVRNYSIAITQAIQCFSISGKMPTNDELFRLATAIYTQIDSFVDSKIPKME